MSEQKRKPAEAFHPSEFIVEEMEARGWSRDDLALRMPGEYGVNRLALDMYFDVGPYEPTMRLGDMADVFGAAFGIAGVFFKRLEEQWLATDPPQVDIAEIDA